jgi:hypothetical protein
MDPATYLVRQYLKYEKGWLVNSDVEVGPGVDVGLLAIDPTTMKRFQIEVDLGRVTFEEKELSVLGAWLEKRFSGPEREQALQRCGFAPHSYSRVLVARQASELCVQACEMAKVEFWVFSEVIDALRKAIRRRVSAGDIEGRTLQLLIYPPK